MADTTHECPCGCGARIARAQLACRSGWAELPGEYRDAVNRAFRQMTSGATPESRKAAVGVHRRVVAAALGWYSARRSARAAESEFHLG